MLDSAPMNAEVSSDFNIKVDYSLTRDVQMTATGLDLAFKVRRSLNHDAAASFFLLVNERSCVPVRVWFTGKKTKSIQLSVKIPTWPMWL